MSDAESVNETNNGLSEQEIDELYSKINEPTGSNTLKESVDEYDLAEGVKVGKDELLEYAKQGYSSKTQLSEFEQKQKEFQDSFGHYQEIDSWAKSNPDLWNHILSSYESKDSLTQGNQANYNETNLNESNNLSAISPELQPYIEKINELDTELRTIKGTLDLGKRKEEDSQLDKEIQDIRGKYSNLNFDEVGPEGVSLEAKVLRHANELGVNSFRVAFNDLMHEKLLNQAKEQGKELAAKNIERKTKLGLLGESKESAFKVKASTNSRGKNYDDLFNEGLEELGIKL